MGDCGELVVRADEPPEVVGQILELALSDFLLGPRNVVHLSVDHWLEAGALASEALPWLRLQGGGDQPVVEQSPRLSQAVRS